MMIGDSNNEDTKEDDNVNNEKNQLKKNDQVIIIGIKLPFPSQTYRGYNRKSPPLRFRNRQGYSNLEVSTFCWEPWQQWSDSFRSAEGSLKWNPDKWGNNHQSPSIPWICGILMYIVVCHLSIFIHIYPRPTSNIIKHHQTSSSVEFSHFSQATLRAFGRGQKKGLDHLGDLCHLKTNRWPKRLVWQMVFHFFSMSKDLKKIVTHLRWLVVTLNMGLAILRAGRWWFSIFFLFGFYVRQVCRIWLVVVVKGLLLLDLHSKHQVRRSKSHVWDVLHSSLFVWHPALVYMYT